MATVIFFPFQTCSVDFSEKKKKKKNREGGKEGGRMRGRKRKKGKKYISYENYRS